MIRVFGSIPSSSIPNGAKDLVRYEIYIYSYVVFGSTVYEIVMPELSVSGNKSMIALELDFCIAELIFKNIEYLIGMERQSGSMDVISPLYVSRMLNVPLEDVEKCMKEMEELKNIRDIINISHSFRNAIIKVNYEQEDQMDLGTINEIVNIIHEVFNDKGLLVAINSKNEFCKSIYGRRHCCKKIKRNKNVNGTKQRLQVDFY